MTAFWERTHEGELMVDHRASPGLPEHVARQAGYDPKQTGEGKLFEAALMGCNHCGNFFIKNPERQRSRASCVKCGTTRYICDWCDEVRREPGYVHREFRELLALIQSGKWVMAPGSTVIRPRLLPANGDQNG